MCAVAADWRCPTIIAWHGWKPEYLGTWPQAGVPAMLNVSLPWKPMPLDVRKNSGWLAEGRARWLRGSG